MISQAATLSSAGQKRHSPLRSKRADRLEPRVAGREAAAFKVNGKTLRLSNLDKVLYPKTGFTKGDVIDYYLRIAPVLLPHLKGRPLTLKRYPEGVEGPFFYEKRCPIYRPPWVATVPVWSEHKQEEIRLCVANHLPTLVWAANLADIELHTYLAKAGNMHRPTAVVFDLDPGPPANIVQCVQVAFSLKVILAQLNLQSFPKTSGSKGLQVYVPLNTAATYERTKPFAKTIAELLEKQDPSAVVSKMGKGLRQGKVFVDWSQNDDHKTTVCVYSLRAKERPTVSTPVTWDELQEALKKKDATSLIFEASEALRRVEKLGDLFAPVLQLKQKLPTA